MSPPPAHSLELLLQRRGWVTALARGLVADEHLAEDLAQDAALVAIEAEAPPTRPGPWFRGILRNLAANRRRRAARHAGVEALTARAEAVVSAAEAAAFVEQQRILAEAVLALDAQFREVVLLRFYEELPQREIARRLEIPKATVNSRLTRALAKLRTRLDAAHRGDRRAWVGALAPVALHGGTGEELLLGSWITKKSHLVALAALVAVIAPATWFLTTGTGRQAPPEPGAMSASMTAEVQQARTAPSGEETAGTPPSLPRTAIPTSEAPARRLTIQVVDKATGEPVPTAQARVMDSTALTAIQLETLERIQREGLLRRARAEDVFSMFPRHALDEAAMLRLEHPAGQAGTVFARDRERVGLLNLRPIEDETSPVLLELWPLNRVLVRVLDELGRAVPGVPIGIDHAGQLISETRAEDGTAELEWSFAYAPTGADPRQPNLFLAFPLVDAVPRPLPLATHNPQEIDLRLPPVGHVRVQVTLGGEPVPDGTLVYLNRRGFYMRSVPGGASGPLVSESRASIAEFWPVGVGTELEASIAPGGLPWGGNRRFFVTGPGPSVADETVTMALDVNARDVDIVGRVVAEDAVVPTDQPRLSVLVDGEDDPFTFALELDDEGRFSQEFAVSPGERARIEFSSRGRRRVGFPLPLPNEDGIIDLGDVRLTGSLRGVVVDPFGRPVTGGTVWTGKPNTNSTDGWTRERGFQVDAEGRFALEDDEPEEDLWLRVRPPSELWFHEPVPWNRYESEIRLVLQPAGAIATEILFAPEVPARRLEVVVWQPGRGRSDRPTPPYPIHRVEAAGRFPSLVPGEYTLAIFLSGEHRKPLFRVDGIQVVGGQVTEDPRLLPLDLRSALRVIDLRVRNEHGQTLPAMAIAYVNEARLVRDTWVFSSTATPILIPQADVLQQILVQVDGYFPTTLTTVSDSQEVILRRGLPVNVRVHGAPVLEEPYSLVAVIEEPDAPVNRRSLWTRGPDSGDVDTEGRVGLRVRRAGEYRIRIGVKQRWNGSVDYEDVTPPDVPTVRVVDGLPISVDVTVDAAAVLGAVQRLRDGR